jgi:hypothetical protein
MDVVTLEAFDSLIVVRCVPYVNQGMKTNKLYLSCLEHSGVRT